jgi:hypothetical protein
MRAHAGEHADHALAEHARQLARERQLRRGGDEQQPPRAETVDLFGQPLAGRAGAEDDAAGQRHVDEVHLFA